MQEKGDIYKIIFEHAKTGLLLIDRESTVIAANRVFCQTTGYSEDEIEGNIKWMDFIHKDEIPHLMDVYKKIYETKKADDTIYEYKVVKKDGSLIDAATTVSFDPESQNLIATFLDITEKKNITQALRRRDNILDAINFASNQFLKSHSWEENMPEILARLGEATGVSRIYCFKNADNEKKGKILMNEIFEWVRNESLAQIRNKKMQGLSYREANVERWEKVLKRGEIIYADIGTVDAGERENMELLKVKSSVVAPIFLNGRWWGFVGFDESESDRIWSEAEIDALGAAAGLIGSAIYKQESYEALTAYITESALRLKEPVKIITDNLEEIKNELEEGTISKENISGQISVQIVNLNQILENLRMLNRSIAQRRSEIPNSYREFISK
ncbi:PAS domain S-box protein [Methanoplanus sp. FWC-SCC4]|uniref:histidine kinase n=1 Tax=Methanochimaera problematica TaxID=2609417 RepID=A0AA97I395_9EURY|nr:PAS domain S-box protein [Methanoplanus sp. FWC-SCC4]WOF17115.1 PAS domain S-box protein [Methanoplanus sp. FWC-SCC4]